MHPTTSPFSLGIAAFAILSIPWPGMSRGVTGQGCPHMQAPD
jgi:hypothetical protein